jgi:hypothetical protein
VLACATATQGMARILGLGAWTTVRSVGGSPVAAPRPRGGVRKPVRIALLDRTAMHVHALLIPPAELRS